MILFRVVIACMLFSAFSMMSSVHAQDVASFVAYVKRVVDGDTLLLQDGQRVRLIGVDTPEVHESPKLAHDARRSKKDNKTIQQLGARSAAFTQHCVAGKRVRINFDRQNIRVAHKDRYGRLLAYVYYYDTITNTEKMLNAELLKEGYAYAYTRFPFAFLEDFRAYEHAAREQRKGLWLDKDFS